MSNVGVARQYAEAAFQIAVEGNKVDRWLEDLRLAAQVLGDRQIRESMANPAIGEEQKMTVLRLSLKELDPLTLNLLLLLVRRRRLGLLNVIAAEFARLVDERRRIVLAEVTTAVPLSDGEKAKVTARLSTLLDRHVHLQVTVDPSIIGGLVVRVGDRLINGSIAGRLATLRREIA